RHTRSKRDWSSDVCSSDLDSTILVQPSTMLVPSSENHVLTDSQISFVFVLIAVAMLSHATFTAFHNSYAFSLTVSQFLYNHTPRSEERRVGKERRSRYAPQ